MSDPRTSVPLRAELVRAYQRIFGTRGGFTPAAFKEVMPVQIMDFPSWPTHRRWSTSESVAAVAAQNSVVQIDNNDPLDTNSLVVVDWIRITAGAATDVILGLTPIGTLAYGVGPFGTPDVAPAPPIPASGLVTIANVRHGQSNAAFSPAGYRVFGTTLWESPANWPEITLTPQCALVIVAATLNTALQVSIGGRYYSGL